MQMNSVEERHSITASAADPLRPGKDRREFLLLLACASPLLRENIHSSLPDLLREPFDWDYLLNMGCWHGVLNLLAHHLTGAHGVPVEVLQFLREYSSGNARNNLRLAAELLNISTAFEGCGIQHVPYKGVVLGEYLYGGLAFRSAGDIDLIVRPADASKAVDCLQQLGFQDAHHLTSQQFGAAMRFGFEHSFIRDGVTVDLHWRVAQRYVWPSFDIDRIWQQLVPFSFYGREMRVFSPECMLATLCIHSAQHNWMHLKMFVDISELLNKSPQLDWRMVNRLVADSHARRSRHVALILVHKHLNVNLPSAILEEIDRDQHAGTIANTVYCKVWPSPYDSTTTRIDTQWMLFRTRGECVLDRFRYIRGLALEPNLADFKAFPFPRRFDWLYFVIRPLRILVQRLTRAVIHDETR
jgi:hypothetical protein